MGRIFLRDRLWRWVAVLLLGFGSSPAFACDVATPTAIAVGTFSPSAIKASAPFAKTPAGFTCTGFTVLTVLSGDFLKARVASGTVLTLTSATAPTDTVTYKLYADSDATTELKAGIDAHYMNGAVVNLLNLLGDGTITVPVFFKLASTGYVAPGTYTGSFSVKWDWHFCNGIAVLSACVGVTDAGSKTATVNVSLVVAPKPPTVGIGFTAVTWDAVSGTNRPKSIPGSKRRITLSIANPDIVATEANALQITLPTPGGMAIALDGDGTGSGAVVQTTEGSPASGVTIGYAGPASTSDQVDFSTNGGQSWSYVPTAGDPAAQNGVTTIRLRPLGSMAALSSVTVSLPYSVR